MQCRERVSVLEALAQSRKEAIGSGSPPRNGTLPRGRTSLSRTSKESSEQGTLGWIGQGTIPAVKYPDLSRPGPPPLPERPAITKAKSTDFGTQRSSSVPRVLPFETVSHQSPENTVPLTKHTSRTPSPEKKGRLLTTLRPGKDGKRPSKSPRGLSSRRSGPPVASKAAGLAWDSIGRSVQRLGPVSAYQGGSTTTLNSIHRETVGGGATSRSASAADLQNETIPLGMLRSERPPSPRDHTGRQSPQSQKSYSTGHLYKDGRPGGEAHEDESLNPDVLIDLGPPPPSPHDLREKASTINRPRPRSPVKSKPVIDHLTYRNEYQPAPPTSKMVAQLSSRPNGPNKSASSSSLPTRQRSPPKRSGHIAPNGLARRQAVSDPRSQSVTAGSNGNRSPGSSDSSEEYVRSFGNANGGSAKLSRSAHKSASAATSSLIPKSDLDSPEEPLTIKSWTQRLAHIKKNLPNGVDADAAKQIFNEIVVQGDEVHWDDVAGLDVAKNALKEAVVYPFLRPDLFMGLREPARGMLLFGPPGTGKTMLARAVATESKSTFFAISASSLTSKYLGESEKLVRALFSLAKALAPSIIFVDEIDSLLSSRGGSSEHEATRRIKTEFLIQWSDLQRAAAGKVQTDKEKQEGDASRVLVLAATNLPWAIDEAARRRFVRRQYIPLPESRVRETQLKTLLGHQKHNLNKQDIQVLVELTDGRTKWRSSEWNFFTDILSQASPVPTSLH